MELFVIVFPCLMVLALLVVGQLAYSRRQRRAELASQEETPQQPVNELARLVWAAHVATQNHDLACLTGTPPEMSATLHHLVTATDELSYYLKSVKVKEHSDDQQK